MAKSKVKWTIIDFHQHPDWYGHDFNKTVSNMDQYGIDQALLLNWDAPEEDYTSVYHLNNKNQCKNENLYER